MAYQNAFTRANPGLIVFLVDQSKSMEDSWSNNQSLAENTSNSINSVIYELILRLTLPSGQVKRSAFLTIIGYGGQDNYKANIVADDWIDEIESTYPVESMSIMTPAGNIVQDCTKVLEPVIGGGTPMASAFKTAKDIIESWIQTHNTAEDPIPVIINISDGDPTDNVTELKQYVSEINNLVIPDGKPLIFNIHLSSNSSNEVKFAKTLPQNSDAMTSLLHEISSEALPELINEIPELKAIGLQGGEKLFMSNVQRAEELTKFLQLGTKVTNMK